MSASLHTPSRRPLTSMPESTLRCALIKTD